MWRLAQIEFAKITPDEWKKRCDHVIKIEDIYLENEHFVDIQTEELIINLGEDSDSESDFSDSDRSLFSDA